MVTVFEKRLLTAFSLPVLAALLIVILSGQVYALSFQAQQTDLTTINYPSWLISGDFNEDGISDLAVSGSGVKVLLGNSNGTFTPAQTIEADSVTDTLAIGDYNRDGKLDLIVTVYVNSTLTIKTLLGIGDGTFSQTASKDISSSLAQSIITGDFNGDNNPDLVVNAYWDHYVVLLGNGNGTFQSPEYYYFDGETYLMATGYFNGDNILDLAYPSSNDNMVSVQLGNGNGTFQTPIDHYPGVESISVNAGDFNNDGNLDLATINVGSPQVTILLGNGNGTFETAHHYSTGLIIFDMLNISDFNGDGKLDLAGSHGSEVYVLLGNGNGTFQTAESFSAGSYAYSIISGDFNGDGKIDIAVANNEYSGKVTVLFNTMLRITASAGQNGSLVCNPLMVDPNGGSTCTVTPDTGYQIDSVTGCGGSLNEDTYTITNLTADCTVTASFAPIMHQLGVSVTGTGAVTSSPSGIDCGSTCSASFMQATNVTLTAADGIGYYFAEWGGDCSGTNSETSVSMTANKSCSAIFVGATLTSDYASPQNRGTTIEFTGEGLGPAWTFDYRFRLKEGTSAYVTVQEYSSDNTWTWDTSNVMPGTYTVQVQVRKQGSSVYNHAYTTKSYVITWPPASGVTLTPDLASPQNVGASVEFTAQGQGGSGSYEYRFRLKQGSGSYSTVQEYSTDDTWTWNTTCGNPPSCTYPADTYTVQVQVRNAGTQVYNDAYTTVNYVITWPPATGVSLTPDLASPRTQGTSIEFTAQGQGGSGSYEYRFRLKQGSGSYSTVQEYSTDNTWTWNTTGVTPDTYTVQVQVRNEGTQVYNDAYTTVIYVITAP